jgi:hypothetical protein
MRCIFWELQVLQKFLGMYSISVLYAIFLNLWSVVLIKRNNVIAYRQEFVLIEDDKV